MSPRKAEAVEALVPSREAAAFEVVGEGDPAWLLPAEEPLVADSVASRRRQFAAGRACARAALAAAGHEPVAIVRSTGRCPAWPAGVVGSISHTSGYAVALVGTGRAGEQGLGIDAEHLGRVEPHLFERLFTVREQQRLAALGDAERVEAATAGFGLKEAFYKAQFPRTGAWVGFSDVEVDIDLATRTAHLRPASDLDVLDAFKWPVDGRWTRQRDGAVDGGADTDANTDPGVVVISVVEVWPG